MAHHKQLREIDRRLDKAKYSRDPARRDVYHHVEDVHLRRVQEELRGTVRVEPSLPFGLYGLNEPAARDLGLAWPRGFHGVIVSAEVPAGQRREVAAHERREASLITRGHLTYEEAHAEAGEETAGPSLYARV